MRLGTMEAVISCGSTRAFAHGKVGLCPRGVHVLCVTYKNTVKVPTGNHQGYIKGNKRITHDTPGAKSYGLSMVYLTIRVVQPIGWKKIANTGNHSTCCAEFAADTLSRT